MLRPSRTVLKLTAALHAVAVVLSAGACAQQRSPAPATMVDPAVDLAITGAHVVDVVTGEILHNRNVFIRDGVIVSITSHDDVASGAARVVDARGRYMVPGLWDMHVHFRGGEDLITANRALLPLYISNGVTTVRDAGGDITDAVMGWREEIEAGRLVGPRILTSGPKIDGPTGGWPGSIRLSSVDDVDAAIDSLQAIGVDYIKIYDGTLSADVFLAVVDEARRRSLIVTGHMPYGVRFLDAVERGLSATEHLYYVFKGTALNEDTVTALVLASEGSDRPLRFWDALSLLQRQHDPALAQRVYARMAERGTAVLPTLHIGHVLAHVDETDHSADRELRYIDPAIQETYARRVQSAQRSTPEARRERRELQQLFVAMVPEMHAAGVMVLAGSDAGPENSYVYPGFALHAELEELVRAGLAPVDALRAATVHAATFMRRGDVSGRIAEGYLADLLLLDENPLTDIRATRRIHAVIARGTVFTRADLQRLLDDVAY